MIMMIKEIAKKVNELFSEDKLDEIARATKFIERKRKISSKYFLENVILTVLGTPNSSLDDIAYEFYQNGEEVSKQALHKKFNGRGVEFFQEVLEQLLTQVKTKAIKPLSVMPFVKNIKVIDSTGIRLNKKLEHIFPQARHQGAAIKLQALMEVVNNQLLLLGVRQSNEVDQGYKEHIACIESGDLYIADLGYFDVGTFRKIMSLEAFYLSRYFKSCRVYSGINEEKIDIEKMLEQTIEDEICLDVLIGRSKLPSRFIAIRLTKEAYEKRQAHLARECKRAPRLKERDDNILNYWTLFVTNLPLSGNELLQIYSLRWQIELLFKAMKTFLQIRKITVSNSYRALMSLHASLLAMVVVCLTIASVTKEEISLYKAGKIFVSKIRNFIMHFREKKWHAFLWLRKIFCKFALKETRANRPSTRLIVAGLYA